MTNPKDYAIMRLKSFDFIGMFYQYDQVQGQGVLWLI